MGQVIEKICLSIIICLSLHNSHFVHVLEGREAENKNCSMPNIKSIDLYNNCINISELLSIRIFVKYGSYILALPSYFGQQIR